MRSRPRHRFAAASAWTLWLLVAAAWVITRVSLSPQQARSALLWQGALILYGAVGALIISKRAANRVGWLFFLVGIFGALDGIFRAIALIPIERWMDLAAWFQAWIWAPSMGGIILLMYVFPDGALPQGRWRWGPRIAVAATLTLLGPVPILLWPHRGPSMLEARQAPGIAGVVPGVAFAVLGMTLLAGIVFIARHLRRARGQERQQLKWFVYAGAMVPVGLIADSVLIARQLDDSWISEIVTGVAFLLLPVSALIAVTRYRLYEIDRLINRTVVYTALTMTLALLYFGGVTIIRAVAAGAVGEDALPVAASTLAVAALFRPARRRIQIGVDRHFNRDRYDAALTVERFSTRLRDQIELDALQAELVNAVRATMQPRDTLLWLRPDAQGGETRAATLR